MADDPEKKVPARFYRNENGTEPVRDWLQARTKEDRIVIGSDIATVEYWLILTLRGPANGRWNDDESTHR